MVLVQASLDTKLCILHYFSDKTESNSYYYTSFSPRPSALLDPAASSYYTGSCSPSSCGAPAPQVPETSASSQSEPLPRPCLSPDQ